MICLHIVPVIRPSCLSSICSCANAYKRPPAWFDMDTRHAGATQLMIDRKDTDRARRDADTTYADTRCT